MSVRRAVLKQKVKCESEKTIGEMIAEDRKHFPAEQDLEFILEFSEGQTLLRDDDNNLFTARKPTRTDDLEDIQPITLRKAFCWFINGSNFCDDFKGDVADLMQLALPFLPQPKQKGKTHSQDELPGLE